MERGVVILGVDPGFSVTGFGIITIQGNRVGLLDCGCLKMKSTDSLSHRTGQFYDFFKEKIEQFQVSQVALETSFLGKNAQTFLKLGFLRGILYLLASQHTLHLQEFAPREVKAAVTGQGGASKDQVAFMVMRLFPRVNEMRPAERQDMTDALAVALSAVWQQQQTTTAAQQLLAAKKSSLR